MRTKLSTALPHPTLPSQSASPSGPTGTIPEGRARLAVIGVVVGSLMAGGIHLMEAREHAVWWFAAGVFFVWIGLVQLVCAGTVVWKRPLWLLHIMVWANALAVGLYIFSRVSVLPGSPGIPLHGAQPHAGAPLLPGGREPVRPLEYVLVLAEVLVVVLCDGMLTGRTRVARLRVVADTVSLRGFWALSEQELRAKRNIRLGLIIAGLVAVSLIAAITIASILRDGQAALPSDVRLFPDEGSGIGFGVRERSNWTCNLRVDWSKLSCIGEEGDIRAEAAEKRGFGDIGDDFDVGVSVVIRYDTVRWRCVSEFTTAKINSFICTARPLNE